ncbi:MAG: aminotransferase class III-fold pyridoxal phosphate-dependent enzyme [Deltaproteobacteria bacterium]|nr:aminotransferase class III-fold pyridoxal phosphate-dependent enzyme [Deltaproteobacteria bacterium]
MRAGGQTAGHELPIRHRPQGPPGQLIADVTPGDVNKVFFSTGGAEANEGAMKIARLVSGKNKIIARYRAYHGSTFGAMSLSGDFRNWA